MEATITIWSDKLNAELEVNFTVDANEDDYDCWIDNIWNTSTNEQIEENSLSKDLLNLINKEVEQYAYENAWNAWQDKLEAQADALYEAWKDRGN